MEVYSWFRRNLARPKSTSIHSTNKEDDDGKLYGVTEQLIDHIKSFTLETFRDFPLKDEEGDEVNRGDEGAGNLVNRGNVRQDLSDWQQRHATLVLSKVKELSRLRFRLCPGYWKERQFWRIYFMLVKSYVAEYELKAVRLAKLKAMAMENENVSDRSACEVEMLEAKHGADEGSVTSLVDN